MDVCIDETMDEWNNNNNNNFPCLIFKLSQMQYDYRYSMNG